MVKNKTFETCHTLEGDSFAFRLGILQNRLKMCQLILTELCNGVLILLDIVLDIRAISLLGVILRHLLGIAKEVFIIIERLSLPVILIEILLLNLRKKLLLLFRELLSVNHQFGSLCRILVPLCGIL